jgi:DNA-binding helix-hairpin-helix protein with protein kinase domain
MPEAGGHPQPGYPVVDPGAFDLLDEVGVGDRSRVIAVAPSASVAELVGLWEPLVYKEYVPGVRSHIDRPSLERLMAAYPRELVGCAAWPLALVISDDAVTGFLMRRVPGAFHLRLRMRDGWQTETVGQVQHLFNDDRLLSDRMIAVHDQWRLQFLRDTALAMQTMHRHGIAVGDLSPTNLLVSFMAQPSCFFIGCDTMRVGSSHRVCPGGGVRLGDPGG